MLTLNDVERHAKAALYHLYMIEASRRIAPWREPDMETWAQVQLEGSPDIDTGESCYLLHLQGYINEFEGKWNYVELEDIEKKLGLLREEVAT